LYFLNSDSIITLLFGFLFFFSFENFVLKKRTTNAKVIPQFCYLKTKIVLNESKKMSEIQVDFIK
jgi:hypothetical protein